MNGEDVQRERVVTRAQIATSVRAWAAKPVVDVRVVIVLLFGVLIGQVLSWF